MRTTIRDVTLLAIDSDSPYLVPPFGPVHAEVTAEDLDIIAGEVPRDLDGVYLRTGPNPRVLASGRPHWFDGDGMIHGAEIRDGRITYRNRWVDTTGLGMELDAGAAIWPGLMSPPDRSLKMAWGSDHFLKDASNTDVAVYQGGAVSTFYQCGDAYRIDARTLETKGTIELPRMGVRSMSAHPKADEQTGELLFFDYDSKPPYMTYGVLAPDGSLRHHVAIDLPGARLPHDMAITENYTILHDLPLFWDPKLLARDIHKVTFYPDMPSRFGIIPRYGKGDSIRWFEADPCYIYHTVNAWEDGDEIVMIACRHMEPEPRRNLGDTEFSRMMAWLRMDATLRRWRFNLKTGEVKEEILDDLNSEFPTINGLMTGRKSRYCYNVTIADHDVLWFDGLIKYDLETGRSDRYRLPEGWMLSESPFAPRKGSRAEDDGYVISYATESASGKSEVLIFDAQNISTGPICRAAVPQRIPPGFHSCWVRGETIPA
ncbi:carotenoid oxygenase family protein [Govanella unica]|uniref:Dioxygenase n=1 Tax=Govanella unica TaxID=2975056 RepID=A0A9X3TZD8_9PROT|nr:carotenoid oxygenase family protein [Govania unica]MDA5194765.1 carotenoid oxygenase family protein [Govania unica]